MSSDFSFLSFEIPQFKKEHFHTTFFFFYRKTNITILGPDGFVLFDDHFVRSDF